MAEWLGPLVVLSVYLVPAVVAFARRHGRASHILVVNVFLFNVLSDRTRVFRLDLTEGNLYTLSDTTIGILENVEEPVKITFFYSSREAQHDWIRPLVEPLKDILSEFKAEGGDNVTLNFEELDTAGELRSTR